MTFFVGVYQIFPVFPMTENCNCVFLVYTRKTEVQSSAFIDRWKNPSLRNFCLYQGNLILHTFRVMDILRLGCYYLLLKIYLLWLFFTSELFWNCSVDKEKLKMPGGVFNIHYKSSWEIYEYYLLTSSIQKVCWSD